MMTTAMPATMIPYSTAVGASSSRKNLTKLFSISSLLVVERFQRLATGRFQSHPGCPTQAVNRSNAFYRLPCRNRDALFYYDSAPLGHNEARSAREWPFAA